MADREWMYTGRTGPDSIGDEWLMKTEEFLDLAFTRAKNMNPFCPCDNCKNTRRQEKQRMSKHLVKYGYMPNYTVWVHHGEHGTHRQGSLSDGRYKKKLEKELKRPVSDLTALVHGRKKKGANDGSLYKGVQGKVDRYAQAFHTRHGPDSDPFEEPIDEVSVIVAGQGKQHGRLELFNSTIRPTTTISQIRASSTSATSGTSLSGQSRRASSLSTLEAQLESQRLEWQTIREESRQAWEESRQAYEVQYEAYERMQEAQRIYTEQLQAYQEYTYSYMTAMFEAMSNGTPPPPMRPPPPAPQVPPLPPMPRPSTFFGGSPVVRSAWTPGSAASNDQAASGSTPAGGSTPASQSPASAHIVTPRPAGDGSSAN